MLSGTCLVNATPGRLGVEVSSGTVQLARPDGSKAIAVASGKRGTVTDRDDPRVDSGSVFARGFNLVSPLEEVLDEPQVAPQLVGDDVHRRLEHPGDGRDRARFRAQPGNLPAKGAEVLHHRHAALEE